MSIDLTRLCSLGFILALASSAAAMQQSPIPPLPAPSGTIVNVSTVAQLQNAIQHLTSGTTVIIAAGHYDISQNGLTVAFLDIGGGGALTNIDIRGATGDPADVVLDGGGMTNSGSATAFGFQVDNCQGIRFGDLSIGNVYYSALQLNGPGGCDRVTVHHCVLFDTGEQLLKANPIGTTGGVSNSTVEYCTFKYTTNAPDGPNGYYSNGIDVHHGTDWDVKCNVFYNLRNPAGAGLIGPAVLFWNLSSNNVVERNWFYNCQRGIAFGLGQNANGRDCSGGVIRNNMIMLNDPNASDAAIALWDCPGTHVYGNTCVGSQYQNAIEYRFATSTGEVIENNLCDRAISSRDGATATVSHNLTSLSTSWFVNYAQGDLHLDSGATGAFFAGLFPITDCTDDWDGHARPTASAPDLGAHQYHAASGGNNAPTVATAAAAAPSPATGKTAALSVLGADDGGEANLTYTWATTGTPPATVGFSANGSNAAKSTTATFSKAGAYAFTVTILDAGGLTVTSSVSVTVSQTLSAISVSPATATVASGDTKQFSASAEDQFGASMASQPSVAWTVSGGGSVDASGLFSAGATVGGPFLVTATGGGRHGTASVTVTSGSTTSAGSTAGGTTLGTTGGGSSGRGGCGLGGGLAFAAGFALLAARRRRPRLA